VVLAALSILAFTLMYIVQLIDDHCRSFFLDI
jgi:hypothetical protein